MDCRNHKKLAIPNVGEETHNIVWDDKIPTMWDILGTVVHQWLSNFNIVDTKSDETFKLGYLVLISERSEPFFDTYHLTNTSEVQPACSQGDLLRPLN